jgi:hypothetical protein
LPPAKRLKTGFAPRAEMEAFVAKKRLREELKEILDSKW